MIIVGMEDDVYVLITNVIPQTWKNLTWVTSITTSATKSKTQTNEKWRGFALALFTIDPLKLLTEEVLRLILKWPGVNLEPT